MGMPANTDVFADGEAVARAVAERIVALSARPASICLSGGSTPKLLYRLLASPEFSGRMGWERVDWFFGDERFVPPDSADSNAHMVHEAMAGAPIPPGRLHPMPTGPESLEAAARTYEAELRAFAATRTGPLFDLVLLGIGDDGHTASLFPGKPAVEENTRWVVGVPEAGLSPFVPRMTLTFPALASSSAVLFLAVGAGKRAILERVARGDELPAGRVRSDGDVHWLVDQAAAGK